MPSEDTTSAYDQARSAGAAAKRCGVSRHCCPAFADPGMREAWLGGWDSVPVLEHLAKRFESGGPLIDGGIVS